MSTPRVEPVAPPAGVPPLTLFTTLARVPRTYERFRAGSLLDKGPLSLRQREIVIGDANDPVWSDEERLLVRLVDELHDASPISEPLETFGTPFPAR